MIPFVLGLDVSPTKIGWGMVSDDDGAPMGCGVLALDRSPEATMEAVASLAWRAAGGEPVLAYIEDNTQIGQGRAFEAGVAVGMVEVCLRRRWPHLPIQRVNVQTWRKAVGIKTFEPPRDGKFARRLPRAELKRLAVAAAVEHGFAPKGNDDAAEGALIAVCARIHMLDGTLIVRGEA